MAKHGHFKVLSHYTRSFFLLSGPPFWLVYCTGGQITRDGLQQQQQQQPSARFLFIKSDTRWWWSGAAAHRRESFAWSVQRWWPKSFKDPIRPYAKMVGGVVCFILSSFIIIFKKRLAHLFSPGPGLIPAHKTLFGLESNKFYLFLKKKRITNRGRERESCGYIIFTLNGQSIPEKRGALLYPPYPISPSSFSLLGFLCVCCCCCCGNNVVAF